MHPKKYDLVLGGKNKSLRLDAAVLGGLKGWLQKLSLEMVYIPGGTFSMGSRNTVCVDETPQHSVTIQPFYMGKYTVTQAQWKAVAQLPKVERHLDPDPSCFKGDNRPVERVSWYDAVEFCARLSQKIGRNYRLPSEAEWEYACKAGTQTPFHFGETITTDLVNFNDDDDYSFPYKRKGKCRSETTDVGSYPPNAFGLYEVHGNIWEWCADPWHSDYDKAPTDGSVWDEKHNNHRYQNSVDLLIMSKNDNRNRQMRGGSWCNYLRNCRSAIRLANGPVNRSLDVGFRVVCTPEIKASFSQISGATNTICDDNNLFESFMTDYYE